ncbi:MAG: hypothetical protein IT379_20460 [Deltaproteobacteria bacterium]|nr:hypothetical protein [Deltaproteobacteria bacterium]
MYSWGDDMSDWANPGAYQYDAKQKDARAKEAERARQSGPRTYVNRDAPDYRYVDPKRSVRSDSENPLIVAVDVTGSMARWPFEIFDRLPLLFNTLAQYRQDLEVAFVAIGDARVFDHPLQASDFCRGFDLESRLNAIFPEGQRKGSVDHPESYGLLPYWLKTRVEVPRAKRPFLIVFGDITMHPTHTPGEIAKVFGDQVAGDVAVEPLWREVAETWDTWFLRSPRCVMPKETDEQWASAIGAQKIVHIDDEPRAVDYAMGLVARSWGHFDDFRQNMRARQDAAKVDVLAKQIEKQTAAG